MKTSKADYTDDQGEIVGDLRRVTDTMPPPEASRRPANKKVPGTFFDAESCSTPTAKASTSTPSPPKPSAVTSIERIRWRRSSGHAPSRRRRRGRKRPPGRWARTQGGNASLRPPDSMV